jgi:RNA polymerase sigma-70 factor (ECF subfamily)
MAAARTDPRAFGQVYERYVDPIYRYCYVQLGSRPAAEDATGEVFLKALAGIHGYRGGVVAAWLIQIARNVIHDIYRRRRPSAPLEAVSEVADPALSPEAAALARAQQEALRHALASLPKDQHAAVALQLAGWPSDQIAGALGKSTAAVYMLRARALARLAKTLRRDGWDFSETRDDAS